MWKLLVEITEDAFTDALDLPGGQVAEIAYTPEGWTHEPLRMIVRRTLLHGGRDLRQPARPAAQDDPSRPARAADRRPHRVGLRLQLHPLRQPRRVGGLGRAFPSPPRPDRGTPQRRQARPGAAADALGRSQRQPHLDGRLPARPEPHRDGPRPVPGRRRVGQGTRRRPAAPHRQDPAPPAVLCPARVTSSARQTILRSPAGYRHAHLLSATYHAALALPAP